MAKPSPKTKLNSILLRSLGDRVRELRRKRALTQEELAAHADMDRTFIANVERGQQNITIIYAAKFARAFNMTLAQFLSGVHYE